MATPNFGYPQENEELIDGITPYTAAMFDRDWKVTDANLAGALEGIGTGVTSGLEVTAATGLRFDVSAGRANLKSSTTGVSSVAISADTNWGNLPASDTSFIFIVPESDLKDGRGTIVWQSSNTYDGGVLLAEVLTGASTIMNVTDRRNMVGQYAGDGPQAANTVKAGPITGANANPVYRLLQILDIPNLPTSKITGLDAYIQSLINGRSGAPVDTIAALRAVAPADRADNQTRYVAENTSLYAFNADGTGTDDGENIITPTTGAGRWFKTGAGSISNAATLNGYNGAYYLSRLNHTEEQLAATISDLPDAVYPIVADFINDEFLASDSDLIVVDNAAKIKPTGVVAGSYTNMNATLNAAGQIVAAANGTGGGGGGSIAILDPEGDELSDAATSLQHINALTTVVGGAAKIENTVFFDTRAEMEAALPDLPEGIHVAIREEPEDDRKTVTANYTQTIDKRRITMVSNTPKTITALSAAQMWATKTTHRYSAVGATHIVQMPDGDTIRNMGGYMNSYAIEDSSSLTLEAFELSEGVYRVNMISTT